MSGYVAGTTALLSAAGAATGAYANNQQLKKQDAVAAQGVAAQAGLQDKANQVVQQTVQKNATDQQANLEANQQTQKAAYLDALRRAVPTQSASTPGVAGASKAYAAAATGAQTANAAFGRQQANDAAITDAPQLTQLQTNEGLGNAATNLGLIQDTSNQQANLTKMRVNAVQANPWLMAAGQVLGGAAKGVGSSAGSGGSGTGFDPNSAQYKNLVYNTVNNQGYANAGGM